MTHPFLRGLRPTLLIAHRGGGALAPENTLVAFRAARDLHGADMMELDVHVTRDGEVVVAHDPRLERTTDGTGPLADRTWAELAPLDAGFQFTPDGGATHPFRGAGVRIPRLAEVLEALPGMRLNVELKPDARDAAERLAAVVRESGAQDRLCLGSEHEDAARHLAELLPDACLFFPGRSLVGAVLHLRGALPDAPAGPWTVLDMPLYYGDDRLVDPGFLERAAALGLWVNCWTIDDPLEMRRLVAEGVGGVMTDRPDLLRAVLDEARR